MRIALLLYCSLYLCCCSFSQKNYSLNYNGKTVNIVNLNPLEYEMLVKEINLNQYIDDVEKATLYRIKKKLGVTNNTISEIVTSFRRTIFLLELKKYDYYYEPPLLLDMMAYTRIYTPAIIEEGDRVDIKQLEESYKKIKNHVLLEIMELQEATLKMGNYYFDNENKEEATYYYRRIFDFPYYKYQMISDDERDQFTVSSKLFSLHKQAYLKLLEIYRGDPEKLINMKNIRFYNNCCLQEETIKSTLNKYLIEVGEDPIE